MPINFINNEIKSGSDFLSEKYAKSLDELSFTSPFHRGVPIATTTTEKKKLLFWLAKTNLIFNVNTTIKTMNNEQLNRESKANHV